MKYITTWETTAQYDAVKDNLITPQVALTKDNDTVHYQPYVLEETMVVCKYDVTTTSEATILGAFYNTQSFDTMSIDGGELIPTAKTYTFDSIGEHIVKFHPVGTTIGNGSPLLGSPQLKEIIIPNNIVTLGGLVVWGNTPWPGYCGVTKITIPSSVTSVGVGLIGQMCCNLDIILVDNGNTVYDSRNNCNAIIETSTNTLVAACHGTVIPSGIEKIGERAFESSCITSNITIPSSVTYIGSRAFFVARPAIVTVEAIVPPQLENWSGMYPFGYDISYPIYVPSESVNAYKEATGWSTYANNIQPIS